MDDYDKLKEQYDALREREGMGMNAYQRRSRKTAIYPKVAIVEEVPIGTTCTLEVVSDAIGWVYPAGKLGGECGELQEKLFKILRDDNGVTSDEKREAVKKELGDILLMSLRRTSRSWSLGRHVVCSEVVVTTDKPKQVSAVYPRSTQSCVCAANNDVAIVMYRADGTSVWYCVDCPIPQGAPPVPNGGRITIDNPPAIDHLVGAEFEEHRTPVLLNDYQVANLRWLLEQTQRQYNNGDWHGEILGMLREIKTHTEPNGEVLPAGDSEETK